jgi:hypothetical protein
VIFADYGYLGAVWVFTYSSNEWTELTKLVANGYTGTPFFGSSVAINRAGDKIIVEV